MLKKDPVFWWASGSFALALFLVLITQNPNWLFLGIASYLLRPTLASLGLAGRYMDERQMNVNYRSGNVAFVFTIFVCVICSIVLMAKDDHAFEMFHMAIVVGLATKALFNVILIKNFREAAQRILVAVGLLMAVFMSFSSFHPFDLISFIMNILPGLIVAGIGYLSKPYPRPAGGLILAATAILLWRILGKGFDWGQIVAATIVCVPLAIGGAFLLRCRPYDMDAEPAGDAS